MCSNGTVFQTRGISREPGPMCSSPVLHGLTIKDEASVSSKVHSIQPRMCTLAGGRIGLTLSHILVAVYKQVRHRSVCGTSLSFGDWVAPQTSLTLGLMEK